LRLAAEFGRADVDAFLDELTPEQLAEWRAFRQIEPHPLERLREVLKRFASSQCVGSDRQAVDPAAFDPWDDSDEAAEVSPDAVVAGIKATVGGGQ
jgi:hypothetical protein